MNDAAFRDYALSRALRDVVPALGTRAVLVVGDELPPPVARAPAPMVVVASRALVPRGGAVRGQVARLPVQRAAATGVWFHQSLPEGAGAERALAEAVRLLQPGGFLVATLRAGVDEMAALAAAAGRCGLTVRHSIAVARAEASASLPRALWPLSAWAERGSARRAAEAAPVTAVLVADLADGAVDVPDAREMIGSLFLPRRWLRRDRARS